MVKRGGNSFFGKHVLLLQGPLGPFFRRLGRDLEESGARVSKINFNGGDWLFYPLGSVAYRGRMEDWPEYLSRTLTELKIDVVLMCGDCRPIHKYVRQQTERLGIELGVFEEGYVRPNYITLEQSGTNNNSSMPRSADFYLKHSGNDVAKPLPVGKVFWHAMLWALLYYIASSLLRPIFPHYQHHRRLAIREVFPWVRGLWRKCYYHVKERAVRGRLENEYSGRFFLVPLQVYHDSQIHMHSDYTDVEDFIRNVVSDFAKNAEAETYMVIKHHPMDRAYRDYTALCAQLAEHYGIKERLCYVHDLHLPTAFKHTRGVVVVNSTVGLSALMAHVPVKVCGRAMYDIPDITYQGLLSDFWADAPDHRPNKMALQGFYTYLLQRTQLNGSLYKRLSGTASHTGMIWDAPASISALRGRAEHMRPKEIQQLVAKGQVAA